jgi:hypothetical protein
MPYFLPFIADVEVVDKAPETYSNLATHKICTSTMMDVLGIRCNFWKTCWLCVDTNQLPVHGPVGKVSVKRKRFEEGEEPALIDFFKGICRFAEPLVTRFVREKTGNITACDTADDVEYLGPTWTK